MVIKINKELNDVLDEIGSKIAEDLMKLDGKENPNNKQKVEEVNISRESWSFDVKIANKWSKMKVGSFVRQIFPGKYKEQEIFDFAQKYNQLKKQPTTPLPTSQISDYPTQMGSSYKSGSTYYGDYDYGYGVGGSGKGKKSKTYYPSVQVKPFPNAKPLEIPTYTWDPSNVRDTFISLVRETYPHGHEEEVVPLVSRIGLTKDQWGNYYKIIGNSNTMFTSHLDTQSRVKSKVNLMTDTKDGDEYILTDGTTILGADDKAGVAVMLYMMNKRVPGIYYFFIGEEVGGIGSNKVAANFERIGHLERVKKCVSFDRKNFFSVITRQLQQDCCSDVFAKALCKEYNKHGMKFSPDPTGVYTDSASFLDYISECTNISVGYFREHTTDEHVNISYLERLAEASVKVDWENLPIGRKVGLDDEIIMQYKDLIADYKECAFNMETKLHNEFSKNYIRFSLEESYMDLVYSDLNVLRDLMKKNKLNSDITFDDEYLLVELPEQPKHRRWAKYLEAQKFDDDDYWNYYYGGRSEDLPFGDDKDKQTFNKFKDEKVPNYDTPEGELMYWVDKLFGAYNIKVDSEAKDSELKIFVYLKKKYKIDEFVTIFDVAERVREDLLSDFEVIVELYETKKRENILQFTLFYGDLESEKEIDEEEEEGDLF